MSAYLRRAGAGVLADGSPRGDVKLEGDVYVAPALSWTADSKSVCYRVVNREQNRDRRDGPAEGEGPCASSRASRSSRSLRSW